MFTQCPECNSYFRIRQEHLKAAGGNVRCSVCRATFNARDHLHDHLPGHKGETETNHRDPRTPDLFDGSQAPDDSIPHGDGGEVDQPPQWLTEEAVPERGESHPLLWTAGSVLLLILLGLQMIHSEREYWSEHERLGPWITSTYKSLGADLAASRSLDALEIQRADIAGRTDDSGLLRVTAVVENTSDEEQPLPAIYIRLEDRWGLNMGYGFFLPSEWILRPEIPETFGAGERLALRVDLQDPSQEAVSFHMEPCWIEETGFTCKPQRGGAAFVR